MSLNSSGLTPSAASTAVSAASGVWLRRVLLAVAAFETLNALIDLAVFGPDLNNESPLASFGAIRLFIHPFFAIAALVLRLADARLRISTSWPASIIAIVLRPNPLRPPASPPVPPGSCS